MMVLKREKLERFSSFQLIYSLSTWQVTQVLPKCIKDSTLRSVSCRDNTSNICLDGNIDHCLCN